MREIYGKTWWGKKWLNSLSNIDYGNRLPRGKNYANKGAVKSIKIERNKIEARVQGRRYSPYKVTIKIPSFTTKQKEKLLENITSENLTLTKLLNRDLPISLYEKAEESGIKILPTSWNDFKMNCSCPDWAVPCKHLAAVIYILANRIDKDPFLALELHDFDVMKSLKNKKIPVDLKSKEDIKKLSDFTTKKAPDPSKYEFKEEVYRNIDFSLIEDAKENLLSLLSPNPVFYSDDFKSILNSAYENISKRAANYERDKKINRSKLKELEKSDGLNIEINKFHEISAVTFNIKERKIKLIQKNWLEFLIDSLSEIKSKDIRNYNDQIIGLYSIYNFVLCILEKGAFIPQLLRIEEDTFKIRWIPAVIDERVKSILDEIEKIVPPDLVNFRSKSDKRLKIRWVSSKQTIITISSLFLNYFIKEFSFKSKLAENGDKLLSLFFEGEVVPFKALEEKETPNSIQLWLNKFYLTHRNYIPLLKINESGSKFVLELMIENADKPLSEPIPLVEILSSKEYKEIKFDVLKDIALLSEHFSDLDRLFKSDNKGKLIYDSIQFTEVLLKILPTIKLFGIKVLLPKNLKNLVRPKLSLNLKHKGRESVKSYLDLKRILKFEWEIALGDKLVPADEFIKMVKNISGIVKIKDRFVLIEQGEIDKLMKNITNPPELSSKELLKIALEEEYNGAKIELDNKVKKLLSSLTEPDKISIPENLKGTLRDYQVKGYKWMYKNAKVGFGSLLADDMGLGKTVQVLTTLLKLKEEGCLKENKALIIAPTTLLTNWEKEIEKFTPKLISSVYHGLKRELNENDADLILTTYGTIRNDIKKIERINWNAIVIDEAQNIKNPGTKQTKNIKKLKSQVKIAMSGTPVENRLSEYWSIFDFINKGYLGPSEKFKKQFAKPIEIYRDKNKLETFKKITSPFILRRVKTDKNIIKDLPEKIKNNQYCSLTKEQAAIYQNIVDNTMRDIETNDGITRKGLIFKLITALKQVCNHPYHYLKKGKLDASLSGKTTLLFNLLENIYANNEKTLIFTQYKEMGDILVKLISRKFDSEPLFLHGGTPRKKRDKMINDFQNEKHIKTFILSLKAGGTGLNLTAARNVIHYDLWWNPAVERQATDRTYRIGQTKNVMVYRLLTKSTFEEKIEEMQQGKKELADLVVTSGGRWIGELDNKGLKQLVELDSNH